MKSKYYSLIENNADPDQLAFDEVRWSGSTLFFISHQKAEGYRFGGVCPSIRLCSSAINRQPTDGIS